MSPMKEPSYILTVIAKNREAADTVNFLYRKIIGGISEVFSQPEWGKTVREFPVSLYLPFQKKGQYNRFLKELTAEKASVRIVQ